MDKYFKVKNNLAQEPKHRQQLGESVWLYLYLLSYANRYGGERTPFYLKTYCKRLNQDKEQVLSELKHLHNTRYIKFNILDNEGEYEVQIEKAIKPYKY